MRAYFLYKLIFWSYFYFQHILPIQTTSVLITTFNLYIFIYKPYVIVNEGWKWKTPYIQSASRLSWHKCCVVTTFTCGYSCRASYLDSWGESQSRPAVALPWPFGADQQMLLKELVGRSVMSASIKTNSLSNGNSHCVQRHFGIPQSVYERSASSPSQGTVVTCVILDNFFVLHKALLNLESAVASN